MVCEGCQRRWVGIGNARLGLVHGVDSGPSARQLCRDEDPRAAISEPGACIPASEGVLGPGMAKGKRGYRGCCSHVRWGGKGYVEEEGERKVDAGLRVSSLGVPWVLWLVL